MDAAFGDDDNTLSFGGVKIKLRDEYQGVNQLWNLVDGNGKTAGRKFKAAVKKDLLSRQKDALIQNEIAAVEAGRYKFNQVTREKLLEFTGGGRTLDESSNSKTIVPGLMMVTIPCAIISRQHVYEERPFKLLDIDMIKDRLLLNEFAWQQNWRDDEYTMFTLKEKQDPLFWSMVCHAQTIDQSSVCAQSSVRVRNNQGFRSILETILPSTDNHRSRLEKVLDQNEILKKAMERAGIKLEKEFHVDWGRMCERKRCARVKPNIGTF